MNKMSEKWVEGYQRFMKEILSILKPIAIKAEKAPKDKMVNQNEQTYHKEPFDHWTTSKDKEQ